MSKTKPDPTKTMSVPEAGKLYFDLGRNASYEAAKRGDLPVIWMEKKSGLWYRRLSACLPKRVKSQRHNPQHRTVARDGMLAG